MKCCRVKIYLAGRLVEKVMEIRVGISLNLALEELILFREGYTWLWPVTELMGLYPAYKVVERIKTLPILRQGKIPIIMREVLLRKVRKWLKREPLAKEFFLQFSNIVELQCDTPVGEEVNLFTNIVRDIGESSDKERSLLAALLRGRNLFLSEIIAGLKDVGFESISEDSTALENLITLIVKDIVELVPSNLPEESTCLRCGHTQLQLSQCGICGEITWYCPECMAMGESLTCRPLFRRADRAKLSEGEVVELEPHYTFSLSPYQERLSQCLAEALHPNGKREWLIWAVCGAGKTETTFGLIAGVLKRGGRVIFTSPRREVVRQMVGRLQTAFPGVRLVGLYGGSEDKLQQSQLTVATVHQLVRFYKAFDLIIFDEVDAFPYKGDIRLQRLVRRSLKEDGRLIYLSATPGEDLLKQADEGALEILTLPARFHRKGVPEPLLQALKLPQVLEPSMMPVEVRERIIETIEGDLAQLYIFLPTRRMVEEFGMGLIRHFREGDLADWVQYTHSQDPERSEKVEGFLRGDYPILVTSTIMERGVTVPKSNVLVLYADQEDVFDHQSLVQMAGRAGRSLWAPYGKVWFVGNRISKEMKKAKDWINRMNREAQERGLLDGETDG